MQKLYIVTRNDLKLQYQLPQTNHVAFQLAIEFPEETKRWYNNSNTIVILATKDLKELEELIVILNQKGLRYSGFKEPDIGNELTAIAIVPNPSVKSICSKYKLAGK